MSVMLVVTNVPDREVALRIARALLEKRLAACVNILAECHSVYRWRGEVEAAAEVPLLVKTRTQLYAQVEALIRSLHPYELPEIIGVDVEHGLPAYLDWVAAETASETQ